MTPKQKLQKGRAFFKFVLTGLDKHIDISSLSEYEQEEWSTILNIKDNLLDTFDKESRLLGLNVPEHRCWCGKEAKFFIGNNRWSCKKHLNED